MNFIESIKSLSRAEKTRWMFSLIIIVLSSSLFRERDVLTIIASLIGVTALIFVGKGDAIGQLLMIIFAAIYAIISLLRRNDDLHRNDRAVGTLDNYYVVENPYSASEVKVGKMTKAKWGVLIVSAVIVTLMMWRVLVYFNTANILFSTIFVTTSYLASMLTFLRDPYYAVCYAVNDSILIVLWILASASMVHIGYLPMVLCFGSSRKVRP